MQITFIRDNVFNLTGEYDIALCLGGLYHLEDPAALIRLLKKKTKEFLIIQTVVTLETEAEEYFVTLCPDWVWGSRFTHAWLKNTLKESGWKIVEEYRNELTYNERMCDSGSSYFLCSHDDKRDS